MATSLVSHIIIPSVTYIRGALIQRYDMRAFIRARIMVFTQQIIYEYDLRTGLSSGATRRDDT